MATISKEITVTSEGVYNLEISLIPDGETVLPTDDIATWLACAGIKDKAYTTLTQVLGDSETYNALLGDSNACAYMARSTTWTTDICADQYAMNLLGQYDTACDALLSNATWASAIVNSTYWQSVLSPLVPAMTSDTTPSGEVICSADYGQKYDIYKAFDGNDTTEGDVINAAGAYFGYHFTLPVIIERVKITKVAISSTATWKIQGSNDGFVSDVNDLHTISVTANNDYDFAISNNTAYSYYRVYQSAKEGSNTGNGVYGCQFYGRTSSSEKIHGGNPTYDSFYRIVDGNNVPVTDPSLLDAGTYTIYSNGLAKDPDNLSNDYGKTVRICPNTKEIVVRPDNALYWWGYKSANIEDCTTANGWSSVSGTPTYNTADIEIRSASTSLKNAISTKQAVSGDYYALISGVSKAGSDYGYVWTCTNKSWGSLAVSASITNESLIKYTITSLSSKYLTFGAIGASSATDRCIKVSAICPS